MNHAKAERFQFDARTLDLAAVAVTVLLVVTVLAAFIVESSRGSVALAALSVVVAALVGLLLHRAKQRPVTVVVGAEGLDLPFVFKKPLAWHDIHRIKYKRALSLWHQRAWLYVYPIPAALSEYRLKGPGLLESTHLRPFVVVVPLHRVEGPYEEILESIRRFHPIRR